MASYDCLICGQKCLSRGGLHRHTDAKHAAFLTPEESTQHTRIHHSYLDGMYMYRLPLQK